MKVRIKSLGGLNKKAYGGQQPDGALDVTPAAWGGGDMSSAKKGAEVKQSLTAVPRKEANLEAEGGETAFGPISGDTIPDHFNIKGPRHHKGGVPLNLPDDTFIFSDTAKMKIKDPKILKMFGKTPKKGGYTPAELAKPYDINKYKAILMDPNSDDKARNTAELMIKNFIMKLGALALAQESKKGFPQGIPEMAKPYMEANGISEEQLIPQEPQEQQMAQEGSPQQMPSGEPTAQPQQMPQQGMMNYGGFSNLNKFVYAADGLVVEGDQTGLITDLPSNPWVDAFQNQNTPANPYITENQTPNIQIDPIQQIDPISNNMINDGSVNKTETIIDKPEDHYTEEEWNKLPNKQKAKFKTKTFGDINLGAVANKLGAGAMHATNLLKGVDNRRKDVQNFDRALGSRDAASTQFYSGRTGANTGRDVVDGSRSSERIVQYGGTPAPMAMYGMNMGGSYYPSMSEGGTRKKVRIKKLPSYQDQGEVTVNDINARRVQQAELDQSIKDGNFESGQSSIGTQGGWRNKYNTEGRGPIGDAEFEGSSSDYIAGICQSMKTGSYKNKSLQWMIDNKIISSSAAPQLANCVTVEKEAIYTDSEPAIDQSTGEKWCECPGPDGNIQTFPLPKGEEKCPCPEYSDVESQETQVAGAYQEEQPQWSDVAKRGILTAATMNPNVNRPQVTNPNRVEVKPALEDYLSKVQTTGALAAGANQVAGATAGSSANKMANLLSIMGKALPQANKDVADVQNRNAQTMGKFNALQGQYDSQFNRDTAAGLSRQSFLDANVGDRETANWNQNRANVQNQIQLAENEMQGRALTNIQYPQFSTGYRRGLPGFTQGKTNVAEKPAMTATEVWNSPELAGLDDSTKGKIVAAKFAQFGGYMNNGGYVPGYNMYPFFE
tara:strand:- start:7681 stop:10359 length:2679 start_codon:yes stop_codon:yes gene_type:complete